MGTGMSYKEQKEKQATFKAWYVNRLCLSGTYRVRVTDIKGDVRYVVERDGHLHEIWKDGATGYERVIGD